MSRTAATPRRLRRHLDDLRRVCRHVRVIHVICDDAGLRKPDRSGAASKYLADRAGRVVLNYLPTYWPDCNPAERVWWRLHEAVTRNHRCTTMQELLDLTSDRFETRPHFRVQSGVNSESPGERASLPQLAGSI